MAYDEKSFVSISDSTLLLLLPPQLQKMTHQHQIVCVCETGIHAGTYQGSLDHWG